MYKKQDVEDVEDYLHASNEISNWDDRSSCDSSHSEEYNDERRLSENVLSEFAQEETQEGIQEIQENQEIQEI